MAIRKQAAEIARKYKIPEGIFMGLIEAESSWNPNVVNVMGAIGLTQIMPATAVSLGYAPYELMRDPLLQLEAGARYLKEMYILFLSWNQAIAAYNAGPHIVRKYQGVPPFKETQNFVQKVLLYAQLYELKNQK